MQTHTKHLTSTISIRLTGEERRAIEQRAADEKRTASNLVRKYIRETLLKENGR
jgi:hypothetical protein